MSKDNNGIITTSQMSCMVVGGIIGTEVLFLPTLIAKYGMQDAWICAILGGVYPIYVAYIANYMCKKFPDDNILKLSKKYMGNFLGSILNILFIIQFIVYSGARSAQLADLVRLYTNYFLTQKVTVLVIVLAALYSTYKGIAVLARTNEVVYYFTIIMVLVPIGVITRGKFSNLLPVFKVNPMDFMKGTIEAGYNYYGLEPIFLLYPFLKNKSEFLKAGIKGSIISIAITSWLSLTSVYYLGIDIMPKYLWVVVETTKGFRMNTIKNFTFIFVFFWIMIVMVNISNNYFSCAFILNDFWQRLEIKKYIIILAPLVFYIAIKFGNETTSRSILRYLVPAFTAYDIIYVSVIALFIRLRGNASNENIASKEY